MRTQKVAVALLAVALVVLVGAGCGTKSTSSTSQANPKTKTTTSGTSAGTTTKTATSHKAKETYKQKSCDLSLSRDRAACLDSYAICAATAKTKAKAYYASRGPDLDQIATRHANAVYGSSQDERLLGGEEIEHPETGLAVTPREDARCVSSIRSRTDNNQPAT